MKYIVPLLLIFSLQASAENDEQTCLDFVGKNENYKVAHDNSSCLAAAEQGSGPAMYSIGMGYGYAGNKELEQVYYLLAAAKNVPAAYLALGHSYRANDEEKVISWYIRYTETRTEGYGYGAHLLSEIYQSQGNSEKAKYWLTICNESPLGPNCAK